MPLFAPRIDHLEYLENSINNHLKYECHNVPLGSCITKEDSEVGQGCQYFIVVGGIGWTREHFLFNEIMETRLRMDMRVRRGHSKPGFL